MNRTLAITAAFLISSLPAEGVAGENTSGFTMGVGYGLHHYFAGSLQVQDYAEARAFDGYYLQAHAGYQARWGGLVALDWMHYSGSNWIQLERSKMKLDLLTEAVSLLVGGQWGPGRWVRLHAAVLGGAAFARYEWTFTAGDAPQAHVSHATRPIFGLQGGIDILPLAWLSMGVRARGAFSVNPADDKENADLGGFFVGLASSVVL